MQVQLGHRRFVYRVLKTLLFIWTITWAQSPSQNIVILISFDGIRYDYLTRARTTHFARLQKEGISAEYLLPVFPSSTFTNHYSLVTGVYPDKHGIIGNHFFDRKLGIYQMNNDSLKWFGREPIWITAEQQGLKTALYYWVGNNVRWNKIKPTYNIEKFDRNQDDFSKVNQIISWLELPDAERPRLILCYSTGCDGEGHRYGPDSKFVIEKFEKLDLLVGKLLEGIEKLPFRQNVTLFIVSDHGMSHPHHWIDVKGILIKEKIKASVLTGGGYANVYIKDRTEIEHAYHELRKQEGVDVYLQSSLPDFLHYNYPSRSGDVIVIAHEGYAIDESNWKTRMYQLITNRGGVHGYLPTDRDMHTIFLAWGNQIASGVQIPEIRNIDVYPTLCKILKIQPARDLDGKVIDAILKKD